jgi:hypothetical protein
MTISTTSGISSSRRALEEENDDTLSENPVREGFAVGSAAAREDVLRSVWDRIREKSESYDTTDVVSAFPPLSHFGREGVWVGSYSRSIPSRKWRLYHSASVLTQDDLQATPPQLTRAYLDLRFPVQLRARKSQLEFWQPRRSQPMYTKVGKYNTEMVYLDLKSAYWSIVKVIGWDVDYFPGMLVRRRGCSDYPFAHNRLARNSLVSMGLPSHGFLYKDGRIIAVPHAWKVNLGLWTAVQDILHGIADEMIKRAGAVYVNTDGYIIPAENEAIGREIGAEWGLAMGEKNRGRTTIYGVGAYSIGGKICERTRRFAEPIDAVYPRHRDKLKRYFKMLSDKFS